MDTEAVGEVGEGKRPRGWCWSCQKGSFPISTLGSHSWAVTRKEQCTETEEALGMKCLLKSWGITHRSFQILFNIGVWAHVEVKGHPCRVFFFFSYLHTNSGDPTQVVRLGYKHFYSRDHVTSPMCCFVSRMCV